MPFTDKEQQEIRDIASSAVKSALKSLEIEVTRDDVMKYVGPEIEAKKTELSVLYANHRDNLVTRIAGDVAAARDELRKEIELAAGTTIEHAIDIQNRIRSLIDAEPADSPERARIVRAVRRVLPATTMPATTTSESPYMRWLHTYGAPGAAYKPILILGGQGSGKTHGAKTFAYSAGFDDRVILEGSRAVEAGALIGRTLPLETGGVVWQDGKIARAFRLAAAGRRVCLLIDEFYRILPADRSPLIPALSPFEDPHDGIEYYELSTDRVLAVKDGIALEEEVLRAPRQNLTIIATSNVGAAFDAHEGDPAEKSRWLPYDVESTEENARYILRRVIDRQSGEPGWEDPVKRGSVIDKLLAVLREGGKLKANNFLVLAPDVRILADAIKMSEHPKHLGRSLIHLGLQWVGHTIEGRRNADQYKHFEKLIKDQFTIEAL